MKISFFPRMQECRPTVRESLWPDEFLQWYDARSDARSEKEKVPLFTCALYREGTERETGKSTGNIEAVSGIVLDYDTKHAVRISDVEAVWLGYEFVVYTTFRHGEDDTADRFRVIVPFNEPVPVNDYLRFLEEFAKPYSVQRGVSLETLSVGHPGFFYPTRRPGAPSYAKHHHGVRLNAREIVEQLPAAPRASTVHVLRPTTPVVPPPPPSTEGGKSESVLRDVFKGMEKSHEVADLGQIEAHCAFLQHGRANAATLSEPEWRSWLSVVSRCRNGREQAHEISSAYKGYRQAETDVKIDRLLSEAGPHSCAHIEQNFTGCATCPLKGSISGPLHIHKVLTKASAQSTEEVAAAAARLKRNLNLEEEIDAAQRALTLAQTREAEAKVALSLRRKIARAAPKAGALDGEDPDVVAAMVAEKMAKAAVADAKKALAAAERKRKQRATLADPDEETYRALTKKEYGIENDLANLETVFLKDPAYADSFAFDLFHNKVRYEGKFLDEVTETTLRIKVKRSYGFEPSADDLRHVANRVSSEKTMHPVKEYLRTQSWDGAERLHLLMKRGFGCLPSSTQSEEYLADVGRKLCISLVARVMDPQAKNEVVVIAQGTQGKGKSTAFASLCPNREWYSDSHLKLSEKDAYMDIQGKWIYEIAELSSFKKSEQEAIKAFISSLCDNFRPPYGAYSIRQYRNTVFVATTNDEQFLDDPTGDRRWAPVTSGNIDLNWIRGNVDQIWAEATVRYDRGEKWWYEGEEEERRARACKPFKVEDAWTDIILHKLFEGNNDGFYTVDRILTRWLNVPMERINKMEKNRLTRTMMQLGIPYIRLQQMKVALDQGYTFAPRGYWINEEARKLLQEEYAPNVIPFRAHDEVF